MQALQTKKEHSFDKYKIKTVPTLEDYKIQLKNVTAHDIVPCKGKTFNEIYKIDDKNARYFFFYNNVNDLIDYERGFDVLFVKVQKENEKLERFSNALSNKQMIVRENNMSDIKEFVKKL
ncbi:hypothetical protein BDAP_001324 [Binucleata daphniae]